MPYIRLVDGNENTGTLRYISQTPSGVVASQAQATNFSTMAAARSYMAGAYPNRLYGSGFFTTSQAYVLEDSKRVTRLSGSAL